MAGVQCDQLDSIHMPVMSLAGAGHEAECDSDDLAGSVLGESPREKQDGQGEGRDRALV